MLMVQVNLKFYTEVSKNAIQQSCYDKMKGLKNGQKQMKKYEKRGKLRDF